MLNEFLFTKILFQQEGAACHTVGATHDLLRPVFQDRIISRKTDVIWPHRIGDLTPMDCYLLDAVKGKFYAYKPGDN